MGTAGMKEREGGVIYEPDNYKHPMFPRWLDEQPPYVGGPRPGQLRLFNPNETLPALTKVVTGATLLGLLYSIDHWARPVLRATRGKPSGGFLSLIFWTVQRVVTLLNPQVRHVAREVSKGAAHTSAAPATVIGHLAQRWQQLTWHVAYFAHEMAIVTQRITHTIIPREIRRATVPMKARIRALERGLIRERRQRIALRRWIRRVLTLRVYPELNRLRRLTTQTLPRQIRRLRIRQARTEARVRQHTSALGRIGWLLPFAGAVPLFYGMLRKSGNNWIRCRNVKKLGKRLCSTSPDRLDDLLGELLGLLGTVSLIEFVRDGQAIEGEAIDALKLFIRDV